MLDSAHPYMSLYLWVSATVLAGGFVLPLFIAPLRWARVFRWTVPADTELASYFGKCLGAAGLGLVLGIVRAARHPAANPVIFEMLIFSGSLLTIVHVIGAFRRKWPWTETAEIPFWAVSAVIPAVMYQSL